MPPAADTVRYRFKGKAGEFISGVPRKDLTQAMYDGLSDEEKEHVKASALYESATSSSGSTATKGRRSSGRAAERTPKPEGEAEEPEDDEEEEEEEEAAEPAEEEAEEEEAKPVPAGAPRTPRGEP